MKLTKQKMKTYASFLVFSMLWFSGALMAFDGELGVALVLLTAAGMSYNAFLFNIRDGRHE